MKTLRKLLFPFSIIYGFITWIRNKCYDYGIFKSFSFDIPVISVGNLRVGGTGKTPQIEYLIRLLQPAKRVAVLSRGYQRKSSGFLMAQNGMDANVLGDEPYQYFKKFPEIIVAVDEKRVHGIQQLLKVPNPPEIILLDDAFQHRSVKPGLSILLTTFNDLYVEDIVLPAGNLREFKTGAVRSDIIIVTKSPENLSEKHQAEIIKKLNPTKEQSVYFSAIFYNENLIGKEHLSINELQDYEVLLVTGIANPKPLINFLQTRNINFKHLSYPDHHGFTHQDIKKISDTYNTILSQNKIILTTEKDYVRIFAGLENCYVISIETRIIKDESDLRNKILNYVG